MCGIAGILDTRRSRAPTREELAAMAAALKHRGPDGAGFFVDRLVGLAHTRLSIIDLAGGTQPIFNEDRTVAVILNGEIFNYRDLTASLKQRGHVFRTRTDTETLVHLYEERGERFVEDLNGQFAIALWDAQRQRLILARDRMGIRPLFFVETADRLVFASEVKALFTQPEVPREIDPEALAALTTFWSVPPPRTIFSRIRTLAPGEVMVCENGKRRTFRYWDWDFSRASLVSDASEESLVEQLRERLIDSVRSQLVADVPVGAYLSGGLDSAIVASAIRRFSSTPLRTFSLTFEDREFDESTHQKQMSEWLGAEHTSIRCTRADICREFPRTIRHTESPLVRTAPTPLMMLSGHVRDMGYKVVLTGEGADEVFAGYDLFKEAKVRRFMARQPDSAWRHRLLERLYGYLENSPTRGGVLSGAFFRQGLENSDSATFAHAPRWDTTRRIQRFFSPALGSTAAAFDHVASIAALLPATIGEWPALGRHQYIEAHTLMSGYLLSSQGDRVAMANSVEGRFPFLDHGLVEFANRLPPEKKLFGLKEKYLLKKAAAPWLPAAIVERTKQPYRAPDSSSFFVDGRPAAYVAELLAPDSLACAGLFDATMTARLMEKCASGRAIGFADNMAFVTILSTMLLHRQLIGGESIEDN
jgi:asparagine synthase (glutamine-hydrolysing)